MLEFKIIDFLIEWRILLLGLYLKEIYLYMFTSNIINLYIFKKNAYLVKNNSCFSVAQIEALILALNSRLAILLILMILFGQFGCFNNGQFSLTTSKRIQNFRF